MRGARSGRLARVLRRVGRRRRSLVLACAAGVLWCAGAWHIAVTPLAPLTRLEFALSDLRQSLALPPVAVPRDDIVIVDIDDASLHAIGRWPWPRDRLATLVSTLFDDDHAAALGIDLVLAEPDDRSRAVRDALQELDALASRAPEDAALHAGVGRWRGTLEARADHDARLAEVLSRHPVTLAFHFNHQVEPRAGQQAGHQTGRQASPQAEEADQVAAFTLVPLVDPRVLPASALAVVPWQGLEPPVPALTRTASGVGFINALPDADGELRASALVAPHGDAVYESFALCLWRQWRHLDVVRPVVSRGGAHVPARLTGLRLDNAGGTSPRTLRVDARGAAVVPYRRSMHPEASPGTGRFRYIPAADVFAHRVGPAELQGRVVLLGSSAPGLTDLRSTPVHPALPGIEVHAQLLAGLEDGDLAVRPDWSPAFELLLLAAVLAAVAIAARRLAGPLAVLAQVALAAALLGGDLLALTACGWALPIAAPLAGGIVLGMGSVVANYLREWRSRRALARLFGHYLPPERVRAMASDPDRFLDVASSAENRELTVLFCDLRGFTPMAERMAPERLRELLNLYFSRMSEIIHAHGGTLDKFIGDAVMAFWGAPQPDPAHAAHAVRAALAMLAAVAPLNAELAARGLPPLSPCIGLASGVVCVGDLGSALRRSYTVVGDGVNLSARIEGLTRVYDVPLLVADTTRAAGELPGCEWVEVDEVAVKGRDQRVTLYVPIASPGGSTVGDGVDTAAENHGFHEQLRLWRLAREAMRAHHDAQARATAAPSASPAVRTWLTELLGCRPACPPLHALASRLLASLPAPHAAPCAASTDERP